jgi:hypothetical protein
MRPASSNEPTRSLPNIQFPLMLIDEVPLRHDHDRIQGGRVQYDALPHRRCRIGDALPHRCGRGDLND